jgi:glycosyltransferase involved in cell wall biosynthesis
MRILHVTPYIDLAYGGPSVAVRSMAKSMLERGMEVHVAVTNAGGHVDKPWPDGTMRNEEGLFFHYFQRQIPRGWFRAPGMNHWLRANVSAFDVLHLHVPFTAPFHAAALAARTYGRPYVASLHGVLDQWSLRQKAWKKIPYLHLFERKNLLGASSLHVTAPIEKACVENLNFGSTIWCLPLPVPLLTKSMGCFQNTDVKHILCIARLHPVKALPVLFKALARLRQQGLPVVLDLAGDGEASYVRKLRQHIDKLGLGSSVIWHGQVNEAKKRELYAKASCFALLSHHENFGLAAAEAMAAGIPVVVSDQVGLAPDILRFEAGSVVPSGDDEAAAIGLQMILEPATGMSAGGRARQLVEQCYAATAFSDGLCAMYKSALKMGL